MIQFTIPIKVISEANQRGHWRAGWARGKKQKHVTAILAMVHAKPFIKPKKPIVVTLTKINPPRCRNLDTDNLARAFKAVRDSIASVLEIDDGNPIVKWKYEQERGPEHGVRVGINRATGANE